MTVASSSGDSAREPAADARFALLFEDIEAAEAGRDSHERAGEYSDLVAGEAADHGLAERLAGALGADVVLVVAGTTTHGRLARVAQTWVLLVDRGARSATAVAAAHIDDVLVRVRRHARPPETLSFASPLRRLSAQRANVVLGVVSTGREAAVITGGVAVVGRDYVEIVPEGGAGARPAAALVPLARIAWVRTGEGEL